MAKKWILYSGQYHGSEEITVHSSLKECEERIRYNNKATTDYWNGRVYPYTSENWEDAMDFKDAGCPFDYPSYLVETGVRGGVSVKRG